ncbi:hypothetical protein KJ865_08320, partial [Myxococcota bacterium]|nr:hypothetical protein [Myxococcota bacterium]
MIFIYSLMFLLPTASDITCRWGQKSNMPPQTACGVPTWVRLPLVEGGKRFEFRRADNPNLSSYFHRKRDGKGPVKRFSNLINLYKVDLFLCPQDFDKPKTILFKLVTTKGVKDVQCRMGPVGAPAVSPVDPPMVVAMKGPDMDTPQPLVMAPDPMVVAPVKTAGPSIISDIVPPPVFKPAQNDPLARMVGFAVL